MTEKQKNYYTTKETADLLNVAVSTVQLWANNGLLSVRTTVGGHRRISRSSVEDMLSKSQTITDDEENKLQLSVMVVEDDAQQLRLYEKHIAAWNMNVQLISARDGYEGMIKIGRKLPDVIITDLLMPNMDGFQMIRAIKDIPELSHTTIIAVSALEAADVKENGGLPLGVLLFTKPVAFGGLEVLMREKIKQKHKSIPASDKVN